MADFLIYAGVDLDPVEAISIEGARIASSLSLGHGGPVRVGARDGALFAARETGKTTARSPRKSHGGPAACFHPSGCLAMLAGRIDNRDELLDLMDFPPTTPDAMLYAAAIARLGDDGDRRIEGDYAAILWFPAEHRLRLARSPLSTHPLHVWRNGNTVYVASNPRPLFASGAPSSVNDDKLADTLLVNFRDETDSWYKGQSRVAAATVRQITRACDRSTRFWSLADVPQVRFARDQDYVDALDEAFRRAVGNALRDVASPAVMLSGGLDSPAVASYAAEMLPAGTPLPSFTWVPHPDFENADRPQMMADESDHVRSLVAMYPDMEPHFVHEGVEPFGHHLDKHFLVGAWPWRAGTNWPHALYQQAADKGCDAILTGNFGNPFFSHDGHTAFPVWLRQGKWGRLLRELRHDPRPYSLRAKLLNFAILPHLPHPLHRRYLQSRGRYLDPFDNWCFLHPDFVRDSDPLGRARNMGLEPDYLAQPSALRDREIYLEFATGDNACIAQGTRLMSGIEIRSPMGQRGFIELCCGIPEDQFLRDGTDRWLARRLLAGRVPELIAQERRQGWDTADWPIHFRRYRPALMREVDRLANDQRFAGILNTRLMKKTLEEWDGNNRKGSFDSLRIYNGISRAITSARFVNHAEGRNVAGE